jgi:tetratricopeptide (TPR) repeat protein
LVLSSFALFTSAQQVPPHRDREVDQKVHEPRAPQLLAGEGDVRNPLTVSQAAVRVLIDGYLAQTTMTLTFRNDASRVLEGELIFPLPEGATVSGYGLDVNGTMVDGVAVEKLQARVAYEKEVHKGIDPGLLEHVSGNTFRTRIYPIPAKGTRTVKVQYVTELAPDKDGITYSLPLDWGQPVGECTIHIEALKTAAAPAARGTNFEGMEFVHSGDRFTSDRTFQNARLADDLRVVLPVPDTAVNVEQRVKETPSVKGAPVAEPKTDYYFTINDQSVLPPEMREAAKPQRIGILWDASMSRQDADKTREIELLAKLVSQLGDATVDVVNFRNMVEAPRTFSIQNGKADDLLRAINATIYDGGTNLGATRMPRNYGELDGHGRIAGKVLDYAYWLLFTDGNGDLGDPMPPKAGAPVYAVSNDDHANHTLLRYLAQQSGGAYLNLKRMSNEQALDAIGRPPFAFISADYQKDEISDLSPSVSMPVQGRMTLAGKLLAPEAKITLNFGYGTTITQSRAYTLRQADAAREGLVPRQWAQMKVAELAIFPEKNHDALLSLGREFDMVTPVTSLLVLETVEQYVQYQVVPPKNRPDVYQAFAARIEEHHVAEQATREQKVQRALAMWTERAKWYGEKHDYPADFKYTEPPAPKPTSGANQLFAGDQPATTAVRAGLADANGQMQHRSAETPVAENRTSSATSAEQSPAPRPVMPERVREIRDLETAVPDFTGAPQFSLEAGVDRRIAARQRQRGDDVAGRLSRLETDRVVATSQPGQGQDGSHALGDANIQIREWDPSTPYLKAIKDVRPAHAYDTYLTQRKTFGSSPAFYLDCADYFLRLSQRDLGIRVLTDVAELQLEDARLLRIIAHRLNQLGEREAAIDLFQKILQMRPEEPQSHRDLALALADRADDKTRDPAQMSLSAVTDYAESLKLLNTVIMGDWDRFEGIQVVALMEANRIAAKLKTVPGGAGIEVPLDARLVKNLDLDVRVVMTWDTDNTDVDLWVTEPSGEKCVYDHNRTTIGGLLSKDFTDGYGPEEYCLRKLMPGKYAIQANFYGSRQQSLVGPTTVHATVITNFGRPNEKREYLTLRLTDMKQVVDIGSVTLGAK